MRMHGKACSANGCSFEPEYKDEAFEALKFIKIPGAFSSPEKVALYAPVIPSSSLKRPDAWRHAPAE